MQHWYGLDSLVCGPEGQANSLKVSHYVTYQPHNMVRETTVYIHDDMALRVRIIYLPTANHTCPQPSALSVKLVSLQEVTRRFTQALHIFKVP